MLSGMLEYIAVFPGGETTPLFVQSTADRIIALMVLPISMYSIHKRSVIVSSTKGTLSLVKDNLVLNT